MYMKFSLVLHNVTFIEHNLLDWNDFYLKLSTNMYISPKLLQLAHNNVLLWPFGFYKIFGTETLVRFKHRNINFEQTSRFGTLQCFPHVT